MSYDFYVTQWYCLEFFSTISKYKKTILSLQVLQQRLWAEFGPRVWPAQPCSTEQRVNQPFLETVIPKWIDGTSHVPENVEATAKENRNQITKGWPKCEGIKASPRMPAGPAHAWTPQMVSSATSSKGRPSRPHTHSPASARNPSGSEQHLLVHQVATTYHSP